ncbi:hypothetical protein INT46_010925 [Mucor plumbeus]|uniref:BTB domain-containing protein n=1 Tax=Mucor plumbeus TaxID=97098 RepID=A0A8H7RJY8_9FUNG|nr:hypothetical protein INT46_010925 [Mucor plumbeus]
MNNLKLIRLDVGGEKFITYYETLKQSAYFRELILNKKAKGAMVTGKEENQEFFIDRDGDAFQNIMHYLRTYDIQEKNKEKLQILECEAEFYGFYDMVKQLNQLIAKYNQCYYVKEMPSAFEEMNTSKTIRFFKDQQSIVASYKYMNLDEKKYTYKLVFASPKE